MEEKSRILGRYRAKSGDGLDEEQRRLVRDFLALGEEVGKINSADSDALQKLRSLTSELNTVSSKIFSELPVRVLRALP